MRVGNVQKKNALETLYLVLLGFIAFSRMSQYVIFDILHLPFYLIEIFFIPFFLYSFKEYYGYLKKVVRRPRFVLFALILVYDVVAAIVYTGDIADSLAMARGLVYVVLVALIFMEKKQYHINKLFIISVAAMIGELAYGSRYSSSDIASINTSCLALMVLIPIIQRKYILFALCAIFGLIVSIDSGYRIGIIILIVAATEGMVWTMMRREKTTIRSLLRKLTIPSILIAGVTVLVANYNRFIAFAAKWLGTSDYAIYRVTERLIGLFRMDFRMSREQERFDMMSIAVESFWERVFPRGLVGKSFGTLSEYFDVPITVLYDAFGSIAAYVVVAVCLYAGTRCFITTFRKQIPDCYVLAGLMFPIYALCFLTNGSFLYITFQCITTGMLLGGWFSYIKQINLDKRRN